MKYSTLVALIGCSNAASFPAFDSFHAHCAIDYEVDTPCADTYSTFKDTLDKFEDPASPQGSYASKQETEGAEIWVERTTANKKYIDDVRFNFEQDGDKCKVAAQSRSQSLSYYDYNVNYCNMFNVMRTVYPDLQISDVKESKCGYPADKISICDRY